MYRSLPIVRLHAELASMRSILRIAGLCLGIVGAVIFPLPARAADPWLFVNDVHFDPTAHNRRPARAGRDTNAALLESALAEMQRLAPHPPVVVMAGDFLAHHFKRANSGPTMIALARRFDRAFPRAQFVIALGNEDSDCGDYAVTPNSAFLRTVATAWAPLVNRNRAAPDFTRTFPRDGFYTAKLPIAGVWAVIVDDTFWSAVYHDSCALRTNPTPASFAELDRALQPGGDERRWLVMHIPPGIDASSTDYLVHHLAIVPFLRPAPRDRLLEVVGDPARHVEVVITGHVHRFSYRIIPRRDGGAVPLLVSPAVSPIYGNSPSFLTVEVGTNGVITNLEEHSYYDRSWHDVGGLGTLGASEFSGAALVNLQRRLERDPALRQTFATLYMGAAPYRASDTRYWRSYWCASTEFTSTSFRDCLDEGGFRFLTRRGVVVALIALSAVVFVLAGTALFVAGRWRRRHVMPS